MEGVVDARATPEAVEHVPIPADDAAPRICQNGASANPPSGETAGPHDPQRFARIDGHEDELVAGSRHTNRREQGGGAPEGQVRALRADVQPSGARGQRRTREQGQNPQPNGSEDEHASCSDRDECLPAPGHHGILIPTRAIRREISLASGGVRQCHSRSSWSRCHTASVSQTGSVEPLVGLALVAGWLGIWIFAARQVARGRRRFAWVFFAPTLFVLVYAVWIALRSLAVQPTMAIVLGLITVPSLLLFIRMARHRASGVLVSDPTWKLSPAEFDYIVWMAIGIPLLAVIGLILLLIGYALGAFN